MGICSEAECDGKVVARGWCRKHYVAWYRRRPHAVPCGVSDCTTPAYTNGWCAKHYGRWKRTGDPEGLQRKRRGDRYVDKLGYAWRRVPKHPANTRGWVLEHRLVMEEALGRSLLPGENVHHRNGVRDDNRPENLELWVSLQPAGQRPEDLVPWAREILRRYDKPS